jgi:hypothetical protein
MIHYHGTPITPHRTLIALKGKHFFVSFWRPDNIGFVSEIAQSFAIDNGAFSAWTKGVKPDWEKYKDFVAEWSTPNCDFHIIPDDIEGTYQDNYKLIEKWDNRNGIPVWHLHEPLLYLLELAQEFPKICIGSSGEYAKVGDDRWWDRMDQALSLISIAGRPITKIHGLRMLDNKLRRIPFHSADSTNLAQNSWKGKKKGISAEANAILLADKIESEQAALGWKD